MSSVEEISLESVQPYLSSDEWMLLQAIDPKGKLRTELQADEQAKMRHLGFLQDVKADPYVLNGVDMTESGSPQADDVGERAEISGGFAMSALAVPLIAASLPILGSLLQPAVQAGVHLAQRRIKEKRGHGVYPPNYRGGALSTYVRSRMPHWSQLEKQLYSLQGNDFWRNLKGNVRDEMGQILSVLPQDGVELSPQSIQKMAQRLADRAIPKSFDQFVHKSKEVKGSGMGSLVRPVAKWTLAKIFKDYPKIAKQVRGKIKRIDDFLDPDELRQLKIGSGSFLGKVKGLTKKILLAALPAGSKVSGVLVDAILSKFGVTDPLAQQLAASTTEGVVSTLGKELLSDKVKPAIQKAHLKLEDVTDDIAAVPKQLKEKIADVAEDVVEDLPKKPKRKSKSKKPKKTVSGSGKKRYTVELL